MDASLRMIEGLRDKNGSMQNSSPAVLGTEGVLHWTLLLMDKRSFRFTNCPGWVDPDVILRAVNPVK